MSTTEPTSNAAGWERCYRPLLLTLLLVSLGLRIWLASTGGEAFWPDEMRYGAASEAAAQFLNGAPREAWIILIGTADHLFFKIVGVPVAIWELRRGDNPVLVASWFGLFSVLTIALISAIARRAGGSARESLFAAFFAAGASTLFYYSRHFFPYDLALFFCMLSLRLSLGRSAWWRSGLAGFAAGLGFLSYNGYWLLGGVVLIYHTLSGGTWRQAFTRAAFAGLGLIAPILTVIFAARTLDRDLIASFLEFSKSITLGDFGRGWIFVWQYLWDAEGRILIGWGALILVGLALARAPRPRQLFLWIGFAAALYAGLVLCADVLKTFVVYGRTARMIVPFLCLAAAAGAEALAIRWPRPWVWVILLTAITVCAVSNFSPAFRQTFPVDFVRMATTRAKAARSDSPALLRMLNAEGLFVGPVGNEPRPHTVLLERSHPLQFAPYLYEGLNEERRRRFKRENISMRLVAMPSVSLPDIGGGYPGPLRLKVKFPSPRPGGEPLLTSGETRKANFVYVQYPDSTHIRIGYDCWGRGALLSDPILIDYSREHEVLISTGAQIPPIGYMPTGWDSSQLARLQESVVVAIDGVAVLASRAPTNSAEAKSFYVGTNLVGGSTANEWFSGEIRSIDQAQRAEALKLLKPE